MKKHPFCCSEAFLSQYTPETSRLLQRLWLASILLCYSTERLMSAYPPISWWPLSLPGGWLYKWHNISSSGGFQNVVVLAIGGVQHIVINNIETDHVILDLILVRCFSFPKNDQA